MAIHRLSEKLINYGFTEEEAEVYIFLSSMGPSPARVVSRRFNINRMRAYRTLQSLEGKGLVDRIVGRPMRFVAKPLQESLSRYIEGFREKIIELETREKEILDDWTNISDTTSEQTEEPRFRIFQGRQQIYTHLIQMCGRASSEIRIMTTMRDLQRLALMGIDDSLRTVSTKGIRIMMLTQVEDPNVTEMGYFSDFAEIRHVPLPAPVRFVTIDERETLTTTSMDDSMSLTTRDDTGLWTNAPSYNLAMNVFFDALWSLATEASVVVEMLQTGITPQAIRVIRTDQEFQETFLDMIGNSGESVHIMTSQINDLPLTIEEIHGSLEEDTEIKILTHLDTDRPKDIEEFLDKANVAHSLSPFDLQLLIVDEKEALMNIPSLRSLDRAVWSNMDSYVKTMLRVFEDYWAQGEEQRRAEEEIRSLALFPSENSNPVLRISKNGEVLYANDAARPLLEERGSMIGDAAPDEWVEWVSGAHASGLMEAREVIHGDRVFSVSIIPVVGTDYVNMYGRDMTEQKRQEEAFQTSELKFKQFFENEVTYCYMISAEGTILDINKKALETLGYEKEEVIGKPFLTTIYSSSSREKAQGLFKKWRETGELSDEELKIITKGGEERAVLLSVSAIKNTEGRPFISISVQRDITGWRRA